MTIHAQSGTPLEVMGLMIGKTNGNCIQIMDSFALPVEGTETRVNAQAEAYEYMVQYISMLKDVGRMENVVGWYHSHPGYGCWLSGIDVATQMLNQKFQEPFCAIDPNRTISSGKVEIGAFRTYPEGFKAEKEVGIESVPLDKIEDFGVHYKSYYPLEVSFHKSSLDTKILDALWDKYWISSIASNPILTNREFSTRKIKDLSQKCSKMAKALQNDSRYRSDIDKNDSVNEVEKLAKEGKDLANEGVVGVLSHKFKRILFSDAEIE